MVDEVTNQVFGTIKIGVSTTLLRVELEGSTTIATRLEAPAKLSVVIVFRVDGRVRFVREERSKVN